MAPPPALRASLAIACALSGLAAVSPSGVRAADGLIVTSDSVYEVRPDEGRVAVTIDAVATNVTPDTATQLFFYTGATMPIHADAREITASASGAALAVSIVETTDDYQVIEVTFGADLFFQQSYGFRVSYVLEDAGGAPQGITVIRQSFVAFAVWAFATPDARTASVEVAWPKGFDVDVQAGSMRQTPAESGPLLSARNIEDPTAFFAYVTGEGTGARTREEFSVEMADGDAELLMLAWVDDPDWLARQTDVLVEGLPALERAIGVSYPVTGTLSVSEHAYRQLGDYAGTFNSTVATIQLRFDADAFTALHEASHAWFNGTLFEDRWILEAFASHYAEEVGSELGFELLLFELTPEIAEAAFPLNDWLDPTFDDAAREDYAYAATPEVAAEIAALAGAEGLQEVWRAADADRLAYAAADDDARSAVDAEPESWKRLLDLLENITGADYDPVWTEWIVNDAQAQLLEDREATRSTYEATVSAARGWTLPRTTRVHMGTWDFAAAEKELHAAIEIFDQRATLETRAASLDLDLTLQLRSAFEDDGLGAARSEAAEQLGALNAIENASDALAADWQIVEQVGLIGERPPSTALADARDAFESGADGETVSSADAAIDQRRAADQRGRTRVAVVGGALLGIDLLSMGILALRRRRRRDTAGLRG